MITELNYAMIGAWDGPFFEARQGYLIMLILAALPTFAYNCCNQVVSFCHQVMGRCSQRDWRHCRWNLSGTMRGRQSGHESEGWKSEPPYWKIPFPNLLRGLVKLRLTWRNRKFSRIKINSPHVSVSSWQQPAMKPQASKEHIYIYIYYHHTQTGPQHM